MFAPSKTPPLRGFASVVVYFSLWRSPWWEVVKKKKKANLKIKESRHWNPLMKKRGARTNDSAHGSFKQTRRKTHHKGEPHAIGGQVNKREERRMKRVCVEEEENWECVRLLLTGKVTSGCRTFHQNCWTAGLLGWEGLHPWGCLSRNHYERQKNPSHFISPRVLTQNQHLWKRQYQTIQKQVPANKNRLPSKL